MHYFSCAWLMCVARFLLIGIWLFVEHLCILLKTCVILGMPIDVSSFSQRVFGVVEQIVKSALAHSCILIIELLFHSWTWFTQSKHYEMIHWAVLMGMSQRKTCQEKLYRICYTVFEFTIEKLLKTYYKKTKSIGSNLRK